MVHILRRITMVDLDFRGRSRLLELPEELRQLIYYWYIMSVTNDVGRQESLRVGVSHCWPRWPRHRHALLGVSKRVAQGYECAVQRFGLFFVTHDFGSRCRLCGSLAPETCMCKFCFSSGIYSCAVTRLHLVVYLGSTGWDECFRLVSLVERFSALRELFFEVVYSREYAPGSTRFLRLAVNSLRRAGALRDLVVGVRGSLMYHPENGYEARLSERKCFDGCWRWMPYPRDDGVAVVPWVKLPLYKALGESRLKVY